MENSKRVHFALFRELTHQNSPCLLLSERDGYALKRQKDTLSAPRKRPDIDFNNYKYQNYLGI